MPESVERSARHKSVSVRMAARCLGLAVALGMVLVMWGSQATSSLALDSGASPDTLAHALAESVEVASSSPEAPVPLTQAPASLDRAQSHALSPTQALERAPFVELGAMDSLPDESVDEFLVRVAQAMDTFTQRTHHEACGVIMAHQLDPVWRVRLTTNRSHVSCTMVLFDEPGFVRWGPDIHSHPRVPGGFQVNSQDVLRNPSFRCGQTAIVFDERFSERDLDRGPGYLVSRGRLLFQKGRAYPFRQLAEFESLDEMPELTLSAAQAPGQEIARASADAAWLNEDLEGLADGFFPHTHCPEAAPEGMGVGSSPEELVPTLDAGLEN